MDIHNLQKTIQENVFENSLNLQTKLLGSEIITATFDPHFPSKTITIKQINITTTERQVELTGAIDLYGLKNCPVTALFYVAEKNSQLSLTIVLPKYWKFPYSFPSIEAETLLNALRFTDSKLIIDSCSTVSSTEEGRQDRGVPTKKSGLQFSGKLALAQILPDISWLMDNSMQLPLTGIISNAQEGRPEFFLATPVFCAAKVGHFSLPLQLRITHKKILGLYTDIYYTLVTTLKFNDDRVNLSIPLSASFRDYLDTLYFSADLNGINLNNLTQLGGLLNGAPIESLLPPDVEVGKELLALSTFEIAVGVRTKSLESIAIGLKSSALWKITDKLVVGFDAFDLMLDHPMDSEQRLLTCEAAGKLVIDTATFDISASFPDCTFTGEMTSGNKLGVTALLTRINGSAQELPPGFPRVNLTSLSIVLALKEKRFGLDGYADDDWPIIPNLLTLTGIEIDIGIDWSGKKTTFVGMVGGTLRLAGVDTNLYAEVNDNLILVGDVPQLPLSKLLKELAGTDLPSGLPEVQLNNLKMEVTPARGDFLLKGAAKIQWTLADQTLACDLAVSFNRKDNGIACTLAASARGAVTIADGLTFENVALTFACDTSNKSWLVSGDIAATCFDHALALAASYATTGNTQQLKLATSHTAARSLIDIPGVGSLNYKSLTVVLEKNGNGHAWQVSADGGVSITHLANLQGSLELYQKHDGASGLIFKPTRTDITISLIARQGALTQPLNAVLALDGLTFTKQGKQWEFACDSRLSLQGIPPQINRFFNPSHPDKPFTITTQLKANEKGTAITLRSPLHFEVPFPDIQLSHTTLSLGTGAVGISSVTLTIGAEINLSARIGIALPGGMNDIFGLDEHQTPRLALFKHYIPGKYQETAFDIGVSIGTAGLSANIYSSPLHDSIMQIKREGGNSYCYLDFKEFGAIRFMLPTFSLDVQSASLRARGGFSVVEGRQLKIPLTMLKKILSLVKFDQLATILPDSIALLEIKAFENNRLNIDALLSLMQPFLSANQLQVMQKPLQEIAKVADKLPRALIPYLNIKLPQEFAMDIAISGSANIDIDIKVDKDNPLKMLCPGFIGLSPVLQGVTLRSFSFGALFGGSLFSMKTDMEFDQFDLPGLVAGLALPDNGIFADSRDIRRRLIVKDLWMLIVYQTGVPVPVPLFYQHIGVDVSGLEGLNVQTHARFPAPRLNARELAQTIAALRDFVQRPEARLPEESSQLPQKLNLTFDLDDCYIQLPEFMGSVLLGKKGSLVSFNAMREVARLMNSIKFFSINEFIQLVDISHRVGSAKLQLFFIHMQAQWLISTPQEFCTKGAIALNLNQDESRILQEVVPKNTLNKDEEGVVIFLKGSWRINDYIHFDSRLALAANNATGFCAGVNLQGKINNVLDIKLQGMLKLLTNPAHFELAGATSIRLLNIDILQSRGLTKITQDELSFNAELVMPNTPLLALNGFLTTTINAKGIASKGQCTLHVGLPGFSIDSTAEVLINNEGFFLLIEHNVGLITFKVAGHLGIHEGRPRLMLAWLQGLSGWDKHHAVIDLTDPGRSCYHGYWQNWAGDWPERLCLEYGKPFLQFGAPQPIEGDYIKHDLHGGLYGQIAVVSVQHVREIIIHAKGCIDGIQIKTQNGHSMHHGGYGGDRQVFTFQQNEFLTGIEGHSGEWDGTAVIRSLRFSTNLRNSPWYGEQQDHSRFEIAPGLSQKIVGLSIRSINKKWVTAIGACVSRDIHAFSKFSLKSFDIVAFKNNQGYYFGRHFDGSMIRKLNVDSYSLFEVHTFQNENIALLTSNGEPLTQSGADNIIRAGGIGTHYFDIDVLATGEVCITAHNRNLLSLVLRNDYRLEAHRPQQDINSKWTMVKVWPPETQLPYATGDTISLSNANGKYFGRVYHSNTQQPITMKDNLDHHCRLKVLVLPNNRIAFKADNQRYLCWQATAGGSTSIEAVAQELKESCLFMVIVIEDNRVLLMAGNGEYVVANIAGGSLVLSKQRPHLSDTHSVFTLSRHWHDSLSPVRTGDRIALKSRHNQYLGRVFRDGTQRIELLAQMHAHCQFTVKVISNRKIALQADNGKYLQSVFRQRRRIEPISDEVNASCHLSLTTLDSGEVLLCGSETRLRMSLVREGTRYVLEEIDPSIDINSYNMYNEEDIFTVVHL